MSDFNSNVRRDYVTVTMEITSHLNNVGGKHTSGGSAGTA